MGTGRQRGRLRLIVHGMIGLKAIVAVLQPVHAGSGDLARVTVAGRVLELPRDWLAPRPAPGGEADLILPLDERGGRLERVLLVRLKAASGAPPDGRVQALYARFLTSDVWSNPGGLQSRRFRTHSPFENEELYLSPPDGRRFAARCPRADKPEAIPGLCVATFRRGGIDVLASFSPRRLPDWELIEQRLQTVFARLGEG